MPGDDTEVHVKLVFDDQASGVEDRVKKGLGDLHQQSGDLNASLEGAGSAMTGSFTIAAGAVLAVGAAAYEAEEAVRSLIGASLEAADADEMQVRVMAGVLEMADQGKHSFEDLRRYAGGLHEELEDAAIDLGVTTEAMASGFDEVFKRSNLTSEGVKELTQDLALVGKVAPGGMRELTSGLAMFEAGMIRGRNPIVQLIASTGQLKGNAKEVAAQLQKMSPDKQMELADKAIAKQADLMRSGGFGMTPSLGELEQSFKGIREQALEGLGKPLLDEVVPHLVALKNYLVDNKEEIAHFVNVVGEDLAGMIDGLWQVGSGVYDAVHRNWGEISETAERAMKLVSSTFGEAVGDTQTIADVLGDAVGLLTDAFKLGVDMAEGLKDASEFMVKQTADATDTFVQGMLNEIPMIGEALGRKVPKLGEMARAPEAAHGYREAQAATTESTTAFKEAEESWRRLAAAAGQSPEDIQRIADSLESMHNSAMKDAGELQSEINEQGAGAIGDFSKYLTAAVQTHNEGMTFAAIHMLGDSFMLQDALVKGQVTTGEGFDAFIRMLDAKAPELAAKLKAMGVDMKHEGGVKATGGGGVVMNGGQTFNIKQDFRDQDPDRVIFQMRRDLVNLAENRRQARTQTPFGT